MVSFRYDNYIRYDGEIVYRAEEVSQQARMLTILALYYSYSGRAAEDDAFMLTHFDKAKALADFLAVMLRVVNSRVQFHPNGGQFDPARSPARTPHGGASHG